MNNFARTLRLCLRYRRIVIVTALSSLIVAVLWGGNIGAMYPVVEVTLQGQSLGHWVNEQIAQSERNCADFAQQIAGAEAALPTVDVAQRSVLERKSSHLGMRLAAEERALARYRWLKSPIDRFLPTDPFLTLVVLISGLLVATIVKDAFLTLSSFMVDCLAQLAVFDLRKKFYRRTLRMELATFNENGTSDLVSRFTYDLDGVANGVQTVFGRAIREPLKMVACMVGAAWICWQLLVLSLLVAPLAGYLIARLARTLKKANRRAMEQMSSLYNVLIETFGGIKVVKAFTMERHERRRFHLISKQCFRKGLRIAAFDALVNPVTEVMGVFTICVAILVGAYLVLNQETHLLGVRMCDRPLTLGSILIFFGFLAGTSDPARKMSEVFNRLQRAAAASDRVYQLLDREPAVADPIKPQPLVRHKLDLVFDNVTFGYQAERPVLEGISLRIQAGETVAIVGPNGCGKSTLANLIPRFFDPTSGSVRLDGIDLRAVRMRELRNQIGIVAQETLLFDDTVLNNIRYGSPRASRETVIEAARQAHAHKFIESKLDLGYETVVGAQGGRLSGGQRQRIALARAILRDPAILILDEATSQIDLESEQLIHRVLEHFTRDRTTILVTHRLATLSLADRIVVMQSGKIIDVGTHDQLIVRCDFYRGLYEIQFRATA
jgi:ATP-binding cassette, subfamily B, bacterial MsbA